MRVSCYRIVVLLSLLNFSLAQYLVLNFSDDIFLSGFDNNSTNAYSDSDGDGFGQSESTSDHEHDPGSWRPIFELDDSSTVDLTLTRYYSGLQKIISAASEGNTRFMEEGVTELEVFASAGDLHAKSVMGFVYGIGMIREKSEAKSFLQHQLAAEGGNMQSKMALAYRYIRLDMHDKAAQLYSELAETAFNSFLFCKDYTTFVPIRIHRGPVQDTGMLRKFHGEDSEDFKIIESYAQIGYPSAMNKTGLFYYFGLRGLRRDHAKGILWFSKALENGELNSMVIMGDIYSRGAGVERNYAKASLYSAFNGLGYLYLKGYGVDKNYTKAREFFEKVADTEDLSGIYYLGMMYLRGIGVKRDVKQATRYFLVAANGGLPKAIYQMAKMLHVAARINKNLKMLKLAAALYKTVAESGPWSSMSRWALGAYVKGDVGKAFILYSRMSELGYEVAQSNAAWILDRYGEKSMCMGVSGFCTDKERQERAHALWLRASKQGNDYAAQLVGELF
ncbi:hypothetical protein CARUB_v10022149mg, partial [Capsella rubella]